MKQTKFSSRKGLSSIIGGMIFLILMSTGISVYFVGMQSQSLVIDTQKAIMDTGIKKIQENYAISASIDKNNNNRLSIQVKNQGSQSLEIGNIWIINKTDSVNGYPAQKYSMYNEDKFIPSGYGKNIVENQPLYLLPSEYDVKVISTVGTIKMTDLSITGNNNLKAEIYAIPPDVRMGENVTIAMYVTNTGDLTIRNVTTFSSPKVSPQTAVMAYEFVSPQMFDLKPMESAFFTWHFKLNGTLGSKISFSNNATGVDESGLSVVSNNAADKVIMRDDKSGGGDLIVLTQDLLARPELFLISPSPQGDSNNKALWGINVVNPTNMTMEVSKLTITAFAPGANNNDKIFAASCSPESISPVGSTGWVCATENTIMWKDSVTPQIIPPFSVKPFLVKITPGSIAGQNILEAIIVHTSVFTTVGSFGKAGYETTMYDGNESVINTYLSKQIDSRANVDMESSRVGIPPGSTQTFNIVLADLDSSSSTKLKPGAKLIINVPKGWENVTVLSHPGFVNPPSITQFADGSTQIVGQTIGELGNGSNESDTIRFSAKAPTVTNDQMYVMYVLAQGETNNNFTIGPLAEIVLQVDV